MGSVTVSGPFVIYKWAMTSSELHGKDSLQHFCLLLHFKSHCYADY